jgi:hypothetical protein
VDQLERLMRECFAAVSFEAGERPDYDAGDVPEVTTVDEFIAPRAALVESGTRV